MSQLTTQTSKYGDGYEIKVYDHHRNQVAVVFVNHRDNQSEYTVEITKWSNTRHTRLAVLQNAAVLKAIADA